jgi:hypothetical protein
MRGRFTLLAALCLNTMLAGSVYGDVIYNNLTPNDKIGIATRPDTPGSFEIEAGDDFAITMPVLISSASFVGLVVSGNGLPAVQDVTLEIYRVFPNDSDAGRTSGPPLFSTSQVPTRVNSPSDVALDTRDSAAGQLTISTTSLVPTFTTLNSIQPGGIHPIPNQNTKGNESITGQEVEFDAALTTPFDLAAGHYFFVPQVALSNGAEFYWLSASRPIGGADIHGNPTTPFPLGFSDLQAWTRDARLDPDWLRAGTDIVGGTTFNAAFSLNGAIEPEPVSTVGIVVGLGYIGYRRWRMVARARSSRL